MTLRQAGGNLGIVGVLSLILFPILKSHAPSAFDPEATCFARAGAVAQAIQLYASDNGWRVPPSEYGGTGYLTNPNIGIWPKLIFGYINSWTAFRCVASSHCNDEDILVSAGGSPTPDLLPNYYSYLSNRGYNYQFMSPMVHYTGQSQSDPFQAAPILVSQALDQATTLVTLESIRDRSSNGKPTGPGFFEVEPPCFRESNGSLAMPLPPNTASYSWMGGWTPTIPTSAFIYGGAWPWHRDTNNGPRQQRVVVTFLDAHVAAIPIASMSVGCNFGANGSGRITDNAAYLWDLH